MMFKRGQSGLDFLMTYGWALLLIVLVVGALFALGVFDVSNFVGNRASGFAQMGVKAWRVQSNGSFSIVISNRAGVNVNITNISATLGTQTIAYNVTTPISAGRDSSTIQAGSFVSPGSDGSAYTIKVDVSYLDLGTGFAYRDSGTVAGKIS